MPKRKPVAKKAATRPAGPKKAPRRVGAKLKADLPKVKAKVHPAAPGKAALKAAAVAPAAASASVPGPALPRTLARDEDVDATVLDRLAATVLARRGADPAISHSARLMSRGAAKVAQKFGEEAVECLIEALGGNRDALVAESADVLYHLVVLWVNAGVEPAEVWAELRRREGVSGIAEKARRKIVLPTTKIP